MRFLVLLILLAAAVSAATYSDAKSLITAIEEKLKTVKDYSLTVYTEGPHGAFVLDYRCVRPSQIRTEILDGAHRGTVVVYLPQVKDKMVKIQAGDKRLWRSIDKLKIAGTPMVQSVLDQFDTDLSSMPFTLKSHQKVVVDVNKPVVVKADPDPIMPDERDVPPPPPAINPVEHVEHDCYVLTGTKGDVREEMAFDTTTLWPVSLKRWKGKSLDVEAQIWRLSINTAPHIDL